MTSSYTTKQFIEKATHIHGTKYDYSLVNYKNSEKKIIISCKFHGQFNQSPHSHIQGHGCPKCKNIKVKETHQYSSNDFLKKAIAIHGNKYDYSNVDYKNCLKKVKIICKIHGKFWQTPSSHINHGCGCPRCLESKGELQIRNFLEHNKIHYIYQKRFDECRNPKTNYLLKFDFYIPSKNILIEYDGEQHFRVSSKLRKYNFTQKDFEGIKFRDNLKSQFATDSKIKLVRIPFSEKKNIVGILNIELT